MPDTMNVKDLLASARAKVPAISPQEAAGLLGKDGVVFIDVRDASEVQASGKVKGALHVSRGLLEFKADPASPSFAPELAGAKTLVLYCASGGRSALAGETLMKMGYTDVHNLGAFKDWKEQGGAVE